MKKHVTIFLFISLLFCMPVLSQQDTVRSLVITEYQRSGSAGYMELTNMGEDTLDLSRFTFGASGWNNVWTFDGPATRTNLLTDYGWGPLQYWGTLAPGKSMVHFYVWDAVDQNGMRKHRKEFTEVDFPIPIHIQEGLDSIFPYFPELEMWGKDSVDAYYRSAPDEFYACGIWYKLDNGDSVMIDQIRVKEDEEMALEGKPGRVLNYRPDVAGVFEAEGRNLLVRKFHIKEGTWNWDLSAGIGEDDSQWLVLPKWDSWKAPTTVGTHGDFSIDLSSTDEDVVINVTDTILTLPWGTFKGDSVINLFTWGSGMMWDYIEDTLDFADSAFTRVQDGDIYNVYAVGNELKWLAFEVQVADPPQDMARVFPKHKLRSLEILSDTSYHGPKWGGVPFYVTQDQPTIDTISALPTGLSYGTRVDTLLKYMEKAPNASWEIDWVDDQERADLMNGDKLVVTAEDGTTKKEYFIRVVTAEEYNTNEASKDMSLAAITWPSLASYLPAWKGDTIPNFDLLRNTYMLYIPYDTEEIPVLKATPRNRNARVSEVRATSLRGNWAERTTTFTVVAENGTSTREYSISFVLDKPASLRQPYYAEPIISEYTEPNTGGKGWEIANVGNTPLDLSSYMITNAKKSWGNSPADAIELSVQQNYTNRYRSCMTPGFKFSGDEVTWDVDRGYLMYDPAVDPVIEPGDVFVFSDPRGSSRAWSKGTGYAEQILPASDLIFTYDSRWLEHPRGYNLNTRGETDVARYSDMGSPNFLFSIDNDSILEGRKPIGDPNDFTLLDFVGEPGETDWRHVWIGGVQWHDRKTNIRYRVSMRHPWNVLPNDGYADTTIMQTDWYAIGDHMVEDLADEVGVREAVVLAHGMGWHHFIPITFHESTVASSIYLVSDGYKSPQTIQGDLSGTTASLFMDNLYKADSAQTLTMISGTDGEEIGLDGTVTGSDTLIVVSADSTNSTQYVLVNEPLDTNAVLTVKPAYSNLYTITVEGEQGTIAGPGMEWGKPIKEILAGLNKPATANLNVIDLDDELVPLLVMNFDTMKVDVRANNSIFFEVIAQDGVTKIKYRLGQPTLANEAFVISSVFLVNQDDMLISLIPPGLTVPTFLAYIDAVTGANVKVIDKVGAERKIGQLNIDDKLMVVSEDGTNTVYYYLNFFTEMMPDYNVAPTLALEFADTNVVINSTITLMATTDDDGMPLKPGDISILWEVISGDAANVTIASSDMATTDVTFSALGPIVLQVTVDDGEISKSELVSVGVTSPDNDAPTVGVAFADITILQGESVSLSATASDDGNPIGSTLAYEWTVKSGVADNVTIASPDQLDSDATFSEPGVYTLQITVSDGEAVATDIIIVVVQATVEVQEIKAPELQMYPNPATRTLNLELLNTGEIGSTVRIFNITGRAVYNAEHYQSKLQIDISSLDAGLYFVTVKSGDLNATRKLQIVK